MMDHFEVEKSLNKMTLLVDTREHPGKALERRLAVCGLPSERQKLLAGDYSCKIERPDGSTQSFADEIAIERKMNIDELAMCFGTQRKRFTAEFERAAEAGVKIYLLVENASWESLYNHRYRSKMTPQALIASIDAFRVRYGMQLDFCKAETTGKRLKDILYREVKERLEHE